MREAGLILSYLAYRTVEYSNQYRAGVPCAAVALVSACGSSSVGNRTRTVRCAASGPGGRVGRVICG